MLYLPTYKISYNISMTYNQRIRIVLLFRIGSMEIFPESSLNSSSVLEKLLHENCIRIIVREKFVEDPSRTKILTEGSGAQWPIAGWGCIGAPSSISEQFSIGIFIASSVEIILPVSWALVIVDRIILSHLISRTFNRWPVKLAWVLPLITKRNKFHSNFSLELNFLNVYRFRLSSADRQSIHPNCIDRDELKSNDEQLSV